MGRNSVSIYEVGLATILIFWFLERAHVMSRLHLSVPIEDNDYGFLIVRLFIFAAIWFFLWFLDVNLSSSNNWLGGMRSQKGVARWLDTLILIVAITCILVAYGNGFLDEQYLQFIALVSILAAIASLLTAREPYIMVDEGIDDDVDEDSEISVEQSEPIVVE